MASKLHTLKRLTLMDVSKKFWHATFTIQNFGLNYIACDIERMWEIRLINYRNEAVCKLNNFIKDGNLPLSLLYHLKENIFKLYYSCRELCLWKITYDPYNRMNMKGNGELYLPHYFTMNCELNETLLVEQFIHNEKYHILDRFHMSCFFCLETETLWSELKSMRSHGSVLLGNFNYFTFFKENSPLISYIILMIEYRIAESEEDWEYQEHFWMQAFEFAIEKRYEQAVYKLWRILPERKKISIVQSDMFFVCICSGIEFPKNYISYFLFTRLSQDRKLDLLEWTIENKKIEIWCVLLFSMNLKGVFLEGLEFYKELTIEMFPRLFTILAEKIWKQQRPSDIKTFEILWNHLGSEEKEHILENCCCLFENLSKGKSIDILSCIVRQLSIEQKMQCLFHNRYEAGITVFDILCKNKEFDMFEKYLSFFLINTCSSTERTFSSLLPGASLFLQKYLKSSSFKTLCNKENFKRHESELKARIDSLQTCLTFVNNLCFTCDEQDALKLPLASLSTLWKKHSGKKPLDPSLLTSSKQKKMHVTVSVINYTSVM